MTATEGCKRLISVHSWYTEPETRSKAPFLLRWTLIPYIGPVLDDMRNVEKMLESQKDIVYTVVCPPGLQNKPVTGNQRTFVDINSDGDINFNFSCDAVDGAIVAKEDCWYVDGSRGMIPRPDVARFILDDIIRDNIDKYANRIVAIANS